MIARPGHPEDVVAGDARSPARKIDSVFIGSCTNGRLEDLRAAAAVLRGSKVAPGVVLKVVPATRRIWEQALDEGLIDDLQAGRRPGRQRRLRAAAPPARSARTAPAR